MAREWGKEMERRMAGLGREWRGVIEENEEGDMIKMKELLIKDIEQTTQKDWVKIDNSTYCPYYRHLKTDISGEEYLYDETKDEEKKKLWARARCGNNMAETRKERRREVQKVWARKRKLPACRELQRVRKKNRDKDKGWWMGLTGRIDEGLLEIIKKIDEEQKDEGREDSEGTTEREEDQKPDKGTGFKLFIYLYTIRIIEYLNYFFIYYIKYSHI